MRFMQIESVLQTKNRSEPAKNRFSVALLVTILITGVRTIHWNWEQNTCITKLNVHQCRL